MYYKGLLHQTISLHGVILVAFHEVCIMMKSQFKPPLNKRLHVACHNKSDIERFEYHMLTDLLGGVGLSYVLAL